MGWVARFTQPGRVTPDTLNVAPDLLGRPLAAPARRIAAMALDLLLVALLSSITNVWFVAAAGLFAWNELKARRSAAPRPRRWLWVAVVALLAVGAVDAWRQHVPRRHGADTESADEALDIAETVVAQAASAARAHHTASGAEAAAGVANKVLAQRVAMLEAEVQRLRGDPPDWRERAARWLDQIGLGYGGALLYFTLAPLVWPGQTPGKKLLRLRVAELTGKPVTAGLALKRFGGYAAGLATGGLGFAQVLWDPNAQALHDKAAHTVVLDERRRPVDGA